MIKDENGKVYVRYHSPVPKYIKVGTKEYVTDVRYGVSMILADEEDVPQLLEALGGCCGGRKKIFHLPSPDAIRLWETGSR